MDWFSWYLSRRKQYTIYSQAKSSLKQITLGVPQGSVLGPVLFLMYITDIVRCSEHLTFVLVADDTTIFLQGNDINTIQNTLNRELRKVSEWLNSNKLILNTNKTQYMMHHSLMSHPDPTEIRLNDTIINHVNEAKFLGLIIDNKLTWKTQINEIIIKRSKMTGILYRVRNNITTKCLKQIYFCLVYPYLTYCSAIWGGAYGTLIDHIFISQKKLVRIMFSKKSYDHTHPTFKEHSLLKIRDVISHQRACWRCK